MGDVSLAETQELLEAFILFIASKLGQAHSLVIESDSCNAVKWVNQPSDGPWRLRKWILHIDRLKMDVKSWEIKHIYRQNNQLADRLVKQGSNAQRSSSMSWNNRVLFFFLGVLMEGKSGTQKRIKREGMRSYNCGAFMLRNCDCWVRTMSNRFEHEAGIGCVFVMMIFVISYVMHVQVGGMNHVDQMNVFILGMGVVKLCKVYVNEARGV
ncbi:Uncharacterized protein TCM_041559 [Theobroma cacao]|uniref:RNase H type-1 domain-containing protein n=1 Tax=Theobroma cacao TaxID=3641 RepID=A0A061GW99_THECC|nr:Uncharacterized protein TCM_041559 [Theobroma cacao]